MKIMTPFKLLCCRVQILRISTIRLNHTELKLELAKKIPRERTRITDIRRRQAKEHLTEPKHGMLGLNDLVWETSEQNDEHELVFRGYSIPQILNELPKLPGTTIPPAEGHFWLLLTGKIPTLDNVKALMKDWDSRAIVPFFVEKLIRDLPPTTPPVEQLSSALNTLQSKFVESYTTSGVFKEKYWEMVLEDCMDLVAKVPTIAALIYNKLYRHKMFLPMRNPHADWASNFALQLGVNNKIFEDFMRLFMIVYSDLHGKNFSGASCLSGSALSDPYKSYATGLNQLASHKSGFYAHDHIEFLKRVHDEVGMHPTKQLIFEYLQYKDYKNKEIPGYTNLDFKGADPRYTCMINFAKQHFANDPLLILAELVSESISEMNSSIPNVDAISGLLFHLFGIREESFFPVMFGISRSLGLLSSYVWDRALGVPLEKKSESDTKPTLPGKGTCAEFVKSHGISKSKLMQNTDIFPVITSAVTNLNVSLRPTSNAQNVKSAHQKNNIDLSSTLPTQESSGPITQISFPFLQTATGTTKKLIPDLQPQQNTTAMLPTPQSNSMVSVLQSQNNSNSLVSFVQSSGMESKLTVSQSQTVTKMPFSEQSSTKIPVPQSQSISNTMVPVSQSQNNQNLMVPSSQSQTISSTSSLISQISDTRSVSKSQLDGMGSTPHSQSHLSGMVGVLQSQQSHLCGMGSISQSQINSNVAQVNSNPISQSQSQVNSNRTLRSQAQVNPNPTLQSKAHTNSNLTLQLQAQVNSNPTKPMSQISSNVHPTTLQTSTANFQSPLKPELHPSEEFVKGQNSGGRKESNDILREKNGPLKENKKIRHIMLSKPQHPLVNASGAYSNTNWGSIKSTEKLNQSTNQLCNKIHKKDDRTKITSFIKEKQPSTNVRKSSGVDYWKCNY